MSAHMSAHQVVYSPRSDGQNFQIQERHGLRWRRTQLRFGTLTRAMEQFPEAEVSELAQDKQLELETKPHPFEPFDDFCLHCGLVLDWPAHNNTGGAA